MSKFNASHRHILLQALDDIYKNPSHWLQEKWHCGTSHCLAGFIQVRQDWTNKTGNIKFLDYLSQKEYDSSYCTIDAEFLGLTEFAYDVLTHQSNSFEDLEFWVNQIIQHRGDVVINSLEILDKIRQLDNLILENVNIANVIIRV